MSDFKSYYKNNDRTKLSQEDRRAKLLEEQRLKRQSQYSTGRNEEDQKCRSKKSFKINHEVKNCLMLSEWMMEMPKDIESFVLVPCPKGIRCTLVIGNKGLGNLHYKNGKEFMTKIETNIPENSTLDCFYVKKSKTIYILDVLQYRSRDFVNCEFEFRNYWIKSKFIEDELKIDSELTINIIETFDFSDPQQISTCYSTHPIFTDETELDGFLYYHKEASYVFGESPLVLWLFAFMVEEFMPMFKVNPYYNSLKPDGYTNCSNYIKEFENKRNKKDRKSTSSTMDFEMSRENIEEQSSREIDEIEVDPIQQTIDLEINGDF